MKACTACRRHVFEEDGACPFCGEALRETAAPLHAMAFGLAAALTGCGPAVDPGGESDDAGATTSQPGTEVGPGPTTTPATSADPSTFTSTSTSTTESTSPTTISTGSTADESSGPTGFIETPDGGGVLYGQCNTWDQDCPPTDACKPWANDGGMHWNATRCSPIPDDPDGPGDPCTTEGSPWSGVDSCDATSFCFHADPDTNTGTCVSFCTGSQVDPVCADPDTICSISNDGVLNLCLEACDPFAANCPAGMNCTASSHGFVCVDPGSAGLGDDCGQPMDCQTGLSCVQDAFDDCDFRCCTEFCDPGDPMCSDPGQMCEAVDPAGVCSI